MNSNRYHNNDIEEITRSLKSMNKKFILFERRLDEMNNTLIQLEINIKNLQIIDERTKNAMIRSKQPVPFMKEKSGPGIFNLIHNYKGSK